MGAAASLDNQDSDVMMKHPPDAMESSNTLVASDSHDQGATPAEKSPPIPAEESESTDKIEKELMSLYDDRITLLEQQEQAASAAAFNSSVAASLPVPSSDNPLSIAPDPIERAILISKYYNEARSPLLSKEELERDLFAKDREVPQKTPLNWSNFQVRVNDASTTKWQVIAKGHSNTVETVLRHLPTWIKITKIPEYNYNLTARLGITIHVTLDSSLPIGAKLMNLKTGTGLYITKIEDQSELARSVGETAKHCANVESLNGLSCPTVEDFKVIKAKTPKSEKLRLVIKCLQPADCKLLWEYVDSEETEGSNTRSPEAPALPVDDSKSTASDVSMLTSDTVIQIVPEPKRKRKHHGETKESQNTIDENTSQVDTYQGDQMINPSVSNDTAIADTGNTASDKKVSSEASRNWNDFKRKYGPVLDVELKSTGIHKAFASGRIWHQHKIRYSATCSDDCPCAYDLPFLTQNLVTDQMEKYPEWNNTMDLQAGDYPRGLMGNFADTFMPKLKAQYPSETGPQHLDRLLIMWAIHQKSNKFGKRCHENCKCEKSWEGLFCLGALDGKVPASSLDAAAPIPKKRKITVPGSSGDGGQTTLTEVTSRSSHIAPTLAHDQAKKTKVEHQRSMSVKSDTMEEVVPPSVRGVCQKSQLHSSNPLHASREAAAEREPYHIDYDCKSSLGFYCVTERSEEPFYCKVISVFPHGLESIDGRIQFGTKVLSYELINRGQTKAVRTNNDLETGYDEARSTEAVFRVTFINTNVTLDSVHEKSRFFPKEWTNDGQWQGKCASGWDGGAFVSHKDSPRHRKFHDFKSPVHSRPTGGDKARLPKTSVRVSFDRLHTFRMYDVGGCPSEVKGIKDEQEEKGDSTKRLKQEKSPRQTTQIRCIEKPNVAKLQLSRVFIRDILMYIQSGSLNDLDVVQWFDRLYKFELKAEKDIVSKSVADAINLKRRMRELELIKVVLKIALHADQSAIDTHSLYAWEKFEVQVKSIDGLDGSFDASLASIDVSVTFDVAGRQETLRALPRTPFSSRIVFGDKTPPYHVRNNPVISGDRKIVFAVRAYSNHGESTYQCQFDVQLSDFSNEETKHRGTNHESRDLYFNATHGGDLGRAQICLRVCRVPTTDYVQEKHKDAISRLNCLIDWIPRFNNELAEWNSAYNDNLMSIGADIRLRGDTSLIHSAIYLKESKQLERLLELNGGLVSGDCLNSAIKLTLKEPSVADGADPMGADNAMNEMIELLNERQKAQPTFIEENMKQLTTMYSADELERFNEISESEQPVDATQLKAPRDGLHRDDEQRHDFFSDQMRKSEASNMHDTRARAFGSKNGKKRAKVHVGALQRHEDSLQMSEKSPLYIEGEWLLTDASRECRSFRMSHRCGKKGCRFVHVHRLTSSDMEWAQSVAITNDMEGKMTNLRKKHWLLKTKSVGTKVGNASKILWSAAFETSKEVCYAVGGLEEYANSGNVSWYTKKSKAIDALMRTVVVSQTCKSVGGVPPGFVSPGSSFQR